MHTQFRESEREGRMGGRESAGQGAGRGEAGYRIKVTERGREKA